MAEKIAERLAGSKRTLWQASNGNYYLELDNTIIALTSEQARFEKAQIEQENKVLTKLGLCK